MRHLGSGERYSTAIREIESLTGRNASDEEIAQKLGISQDEYCDWQSQLKITNVVSLNEFMESGSDVPNARNSSSHFANPEERYEENELKEVLRDSLNLLTEKERKVIELYYYEDLTLKEISVILEVSESRVSQLHTKALTRMKDKMGKYMGFLAGA